MISVPSDQLDDRQDWLKGPDSKQDFVPSVPPGSRSQSQKQRAVAAARKALDQAKGLKSAGQLRKAFLACQSVLIDHSHNLPDGLSAKIHHFMGMISLAQGKQQRAEKYIKRALSLDSSLSGMEQASTDLSISEPIIEKPQALASKEVESLPEAVTSDVDHNPVVESEPETIAGPDALVSLQSGKGRLAWVASFWARGVAFVMDVVLVVVLIALMMALSSLLLGFSKEDLVSVLAGSFSNLLVVFFLFVLFLLSYLTLFSRFGGQTLGKIVLGLRVVRLDGHSLTNTNALLRGLGMLLAALPGLGGFVWAAFDLKKRGWHDRIGKTLVVKIKPPVRVEKEGPNISTEALEHE